MVETSGSCRRCGAPYSYNRRSGPPRQFCGAECGRLWHIAYLRDRRKAARPNIVHRMWISHPCRDCPTILPTYEITGNGVVGVQYLCKGCRAKPRRYRPAASLEGLSTTCRNGHRRTIRNTRIGSKGEPDCRVCRSIASRRSRERRAMVCEEAPDAS